MSDKPTEERKAPPRGLEHCPSRDEVWEMLFMEEPVQRLFTQFCRVLSQDDILKE